MQIVWDEPKRLANLDKHRMDFADLTVEFFTAATIFPAKDKRLIALGRLGRKVVCTVVFVPLGSEAISVISMRPASSRERKLI